MATSSFQQSIEGLWYKAKPIWLWLFFPVHLVMRLVVFLRQLFYRLGWFKSHKLDALVLVIGNITVGGTGKTPLAIYLLKLLTAKGYKVGLVTRGYGAQSTEFPLLVNEQTDALNCGDEPYLIYKNSKAPLVVDPKRPRGAKFLQEQHGCEIILCDDGLQHYALQRDIELLVVDHKRGFGNGFLLPLGPLREPVARAKSCDLSVINGQSMTMSPLPIRSVADQSLAELSSLLEPINAVAGIGNPQGFFNSLKELKLTFVERPFPDHHPFCLADFDGMKGTIVMTEKDAVKCQQFADERFYYLPVEAKLEPELEQQIITLIESKMKVENE